MVKAIRLVLNRLRICECIFSYPEELPIERLEEYNDLVIKYMGAKFGNDNIVMACCHVQDEAGVPHLHLDIIPIDNGKLSSKTLITRDFITSIHRLMPMVLRNHGFNVENYRKFIQCAADFYGEEKVITQYGGEFFAANRENATKYVAVLLEVYRELRERNFAFRQGDEFIVALAANRLKDSIRNAGAYIYRYWTGYPFRLVSTCYEYNPVSVLHMPDEKKDGIIKIFDCYVAKGKYPSREKIYKLCHLRNPKLKNVIRIFLARLLK